MPNEIINGSDTSITNVVQDIANSLSSKDNSVQFYTEPIDDKNFVKLNDTDLLNMFSTTFSQIPQIASSAINVASSEQVKKVVEDGVFKVVFKNGVNDKTIADLYKNSEGLLITAYRDSKGINQAGLSSVGDNINKPLNFSNAASIINGTMAVLSIAVGSYYMHNINNNLKDINSKLDKLIGFVNDTNLSKLKTIHQSLVTINRDYSLNSLNERQITAYHSEVVRYCNDTLDISNFYESQLDKIIQNFSNSDKNTFEKSFKNNFSEFQNDLNCYRLAVGLHIIAATIEVIISGNQSEEFINNHVSDIHNYCDKCKEKLNTWNNDVSSWIEKTKALDPEWWKKAMNYLPYAIPGQIERDIITKILNDMMPGKGENATLTEMLNKNLEMKSKKKRDEYLQNHIKSDVFEKFEINTTMVDNYAKRINLIKNNEVCLFYRNEEIYIDKKYLNDLETEEN